MKPCTVLFLVAVLTASGAVRGASIAARSECDPWALRPCAPVILWSAPPSSACCARLREQRRCLCRYARNPDLGRYINSQNSKEVAAACRVRVPMC
ncbi:putative non-specific lipid-transfer protein AKCS9 [Triticum urartu]|uniref:Putative non-specific lipid-transfer protein AKCS9 n=1 Tax=Triticum urartu TaxID=4572 RepID=M7ZRJ5_TRIUA|nr:non-specific lipid-transfer protein 2-like [Triticum urartu]EMS65828.1 putative non-specific lipid-transfer protein AKCS9 [Triticum urartu]